jgi:proton-dependent oligopeptide transporter, POT family
MSASAKPTEPAPSLPPEEKSTAPVERDDRMPRGIPFIIANEFAERFCYYGINAILSVYMTQFLRLGEADATAGHSFFKFSAYFFPLVGAVVADVFWGKYRTIMTFSLAYATGCAVVAAVPGKLGLFLGLFLVAFGTGGIKPCVSTNVGDQFTSKNQHLIERAFSYFYLSINAGSSISIYFCPVLLDPFDPDAPRWAADFLIRHGIYGRGAAFGVPATAMFLATLVFWLGRRKYAIVPPQGKKWLKDVLSKEGLGTIGRLSIIYVFIAVFWALWDQSNGQTWVLQAESSLMDKDLGFGIKVLAAQIQVVNGLLILGMVPVFTFVIYPLVGKLVKVTPLRRIGVGLFVAASSFLIVSWIEGRIQGGHVVSAWWQILAYVVLSASEVLVSITGLEFSYKQAPLRMKSSVMALYLVAVAIGNLMTGVVNYAMVKPVHATAVETGAQTWVTVEGESFVVGQKIDFSGKSGVTMTMPSGKTDDLKGTFLVAEVQGNRLELMDNRDRKPVVTQGVFDAEHAEVSTYRLVGPQYFNFFAAAMAAMGVLFIFVARRYRERTYVREEGGATSS